MSLWVGLISFAYEILVYLRDVKRLKDINLVPYAPCGNNKTEKI